MHVYKVIWLKHWGVWKQLKDREWKYTAAGVGNNSMADKSSLDLGMLLRVRQLDQQVNFLNSFQVWWFCGWEPRLS